MKTSSEKILLQCAGIARARVRAIEDLPALNVTLSAEDIRHGSRELSTALRPRSTSSSRSSSLTRVAGVLIVISLKLSKAGCDDRLMSIGWSAGGR